MENYLIMLTKMNIKLILKEKKVLLSNQDHQIKKKFEHSYFKKKLYEIGYSWLESESFYNEAPGHFHFKLFHKSKKHNFIFDF